MHTEIKMAFTDTAEKGSHYEAPYTLHFPEKYDVTESYDPNNLHHAAASIVKTADNMTAQALNGFTRNGKPRYLLVGENHAMSDHKAIVMKLMENLRAQGYKIAFIQERPHNLFSSKIDGLPQQVIQDLLTQEKPIWHGATPCLFDDITTANMSTHMLYRYLIEHNIPTHLGDAAKINDETLDLNDPATRTATHKVLGHQELLPTISAIDNLGITIRNTMIQDQTEQFVGSLPPNEAPDFVIVYGGAAHTAGNIWSKYLFKDSLLAGFSNAGHDVIGMPLVRKFPGYYKIPVSAKACRNLTLSNHHIGEEFYEEEEEEIKHLRQILPLIGLDEQVEKLKTLQNFRDEQAVKLSNDVCKTLKKALQAEDYQFPYITTINRINYATHLEF